jgi:hypothetical protein
LIHNDHATLKQTIEILQKASQDRTEKDINMLKPIIDDLNFFRDRISNISAKEYTEVCNNMQYEFKDSGETIIKQGEMG